MQGAQALFLVGELRSYMLQSTFKMLKRKKKAKSKESNSYPLPLRSTHNGNILKVNFRKTLKVNCPSQPQQTWRSNSSTALEEGGGGRRRAEEGRGGERRAEEGRGGQ